MTALVWDERLINRNRAADLCGTWGISTDGDYFRCSTCGGNITQLPGAGKSFTIDDLIGLVLGHMVKCHEYSLSGGPQRGTAR